MNLLVITNAGLFPSVGRPGAGLFFANMLRRLVPHVGRIVAVTPVAYIPGPLLALGRFRQQSLIAAHESWNGIEVIRPPYLSLSADQHLWFQARWYLRAAAPLCEVLHRRHRFDLVVGYGFGPPAHAAQYVARQTGLRCVSWAIGTDVHTSPGQSAENASLFRHNVRHTDLILTESAALRGDILRSCPQARHVHTYYKGIDLEGLGGTVDRAAVRAQLGLAPGRTYLLMAGRVWLPKGAYEFYEAFQRLAAARPTLDAVWVGDGLDARNLRQMAQRDGLTDRFKITGNVPRERVLEYMRAADLLVFPSHAEGLPNVVMEGMAAGLPAISTDVGGVGEIIVPGVTGLLIPPKDAGAIVAAVEHVLGSPDRGAAMAARGRRFIWDYFNVDRNAPIALNILRHIAGGGAPEDPVASAAGVAPGRLPRDLLADNVP